MLRRQSHTLRRTNVSVSAKTRERRRLTEVAAPNGARLWAAWGRETQVCGPVTLCFVAAHGPRPGPPAQGLHWLAHCRPAAAVRAWGAFPCGARAVLAPA